MSIINLVTYEMYIHDICHILRNKLDKNLDISKKNSKKNVTFVTYFNSSVLFLVETVIEIVKN